MTIIKVGKDHLSLKEIGDRVKNYQNLENKINEISQKKQLYQNRNINISELDINIPDHVMGHFLNINKVIIYI